MKPSYHLVGIAFLVVLAIVLVIIWTSYAPGAGDVAPAIDTRNM